MILALLASLFLLCAGGLRAHEVFPSIVRVIPQGDALGLEFETTLEAMMAGVDLSLFEDTDSAPNADSYSQLRALSAEELGERIAGFLPVFLANLRIEIDGRPATPEFAGHRILDPGDDELARRSFLDFSLPVPPGARTIALGWDEPYGALILRQEGVEQPYTATLPGGDMSAPFALTGGSTQTGGQAFFAYVPIGFDHILPQGLDHILFVLGLFLLAARLRPLLWQVSAFTAAHTVTLGLGAMGWVSVPSSIVEPLIAASICYVAIENVFTAKLHRWRPVVVFGFGLLHGLGFASVLEEFGLPDAQFVPALLGFNVGVELGQLTVIAIAFLAVGAWFRDRPWYRQAITIPASLAIATIGAWWVVERTML